MDKWRVLTREVWIQGVDVDAENEEDAIERVRRNEGHLADDVFEYSHQLKSESWTAEKRNE